MTDPIDPLRRVDPARRRMEDRASAYGEAASGTEPAPGLPVPVEPVARAKDPPPERRRSFAAFAAHLLGQGGQKRGLRGGKPVLDAARTAYLETEYAGPLDRRSTTGQVKSKKI